RLNTGKIQREPTFQVVLDALALTPYYSAFLITADVPEVYMHQFWDSIYKHDTFYRFKIDKWKTFKLTLEVFREIFKICPRVQGQVFDALPTDEEIISFLRDLGHTREIHSLNDVTTGLDKLCLSRAQILWGMYHQKNVDYVELLWEDFIHQIDNKAYKKQDKINKIGIHTSKDDYLINTLRFVSAREETQIYGAILPESLTSPKMKETKAYKTYLGFATRATPPKKARKFKKSASPKLTTVLVSTKEPTGKSKRVKKPTKKSTQAPARGFVIRETPEVRVSKKKEKVDVARGKGIELLSDVAIKEDAQFEEVRRKSIRDFHKTYPSGSATATKPTPSAIIKPSVTNKGTGIKPGVPDVTEEVSSESEAESWGNDDDDSNNDQDSGSEGNDQQKDSEDDKTQSDNKDESNSKHETDDNESGSEFDQEEDDEKIKDDEEEEEEDGLYYKSAIDDVDIRMNEPVDADKGFVQEEEAEIVSPLDVHVHHEVPSQQTPTLLTVHVSVISESSPVFSTIILQSLKSFIPPLLLTSTPPPTTEATNPPSILPDFTSVFQFNNRVTTLEKEVAELKKDPFYTQVTALVDDYLNARLGVTREEFMNFLLGSLTARITEQMIQESLEDVVLAKESSQPQSSYEAAATLTEFELKKNLIDKMDKSESYLAAPEHRECYEGLIKSYDLDKSLFSIYGKVYSLKRSKKDKDKDEDPSAGSKRGLEKRKTSKDAEPTKGPKDKESQSGLSKGDKSQSKSSVKSVQSEEPEFEVANLDMP
ncbi:hypothetical protein Tco_0943029, partial [Tanacetum coccineum]